MSTKAAEDKQEQTDQEMKPAFTTALVSEHPLSNYMELYRAAIQAQGKFDTEVLMILIKDLFGCTWKGPRVSEQHPK